MNVLFVCLGNICRSPIAEGILKQLYLTHGIDARVESAGFESFHINDSPDPRAMRVCAQHGIDLSQKKARLFREEDFHQFDRIYVMDQKNYQDVIETAINESDAQKVDFLLNLTHPGKNLPVPDPYYKGLDECEKVFELMSNACKKLVETVKNQ
jgi:protein-tyrosine phosphatase